MLWPGVVLPCVLSAGGGRCLGAHISHPAAASKDHHARPSNAVMHMTLFNLSSSEARMRALLRPGRQGRCHHVAKLPPERAKLQPKNRAGISIRGQKPKGRHGGEDYSPNNRVCIKSRPGREGFRELRSARGTRAAHPSRRPLYLYPAVSYL
ncbi:hypothetical protein DFH27DRAFT_191590 [Peziza echinospora]|nr:hypothetical protein DFH27DRAFT_191590 [Peziza echinospora]